MENIELVKTTLLEMIETAGENGITEGQATKELVTRYKWAIMKPLKPYGMDIMKSG